jgi:hypothetical protein
MVVLLLDSDSVGVVVAKVLRRKSLSRSQGAARGLAIGADWVETGSIVSTIESVSIAIVTVSSTIVSVVSQTVSIATATDTIWTRTVSV